MKASRAAIRQMRTVESMGEQLDALSGKLDRILTALGLPTEAPQDAPAEVAMASAEPDEYAAIEPANDPEPASPDASQRSQLEENRERLSTRGKRK